MIYSDDLVLAISQSGETADTLAAMELAKNKGATVFGICNVVGSSIPRMSHAGAYTHAGPEIGVASTKAFTAQVTVLTLMALALANLRDQMNQDEVREVLNALEAIPSKIEECLKLDAQIQEIAQEYHNAKNFLYLGRGYNFPVALEGALKLKEISYIHAEGYPAAEMKHGPIALIDEEMPVVFVATKGANYEKVVSNVQEVKARKGKIIALASHQDPHLEASVRSYHSSTRDFGMLESSAQYHSTQLLSYHIAVLRECNVDQPRNLAKSVTVE